ncbi:MAG: GNAT family N-acetyltransferase [Steroidobacteraceae bacterium]
MSVRVAGITDAGQIVAIYAPIVADTVISFELEVPDAAIMRQRIDTTLRTHPWLVSVDAAGLIDGYAYASRHRERAAYQWSVDVTAYVRADRRRSGVGAKLYAALLPLLVRQGYYQAFAGIALPNPGSIALHEKMGFEHLGTYREVGFKLGAWHDVGWWQKRLQPAHSPAPPIPFSELPAPHETPHQP